MDGYEWGVMWARVSDEPHRDGMTERQARNWVAEVEADGARQGAFTVVKRVLGPWEPA